MINLEHLRKQEIKAGYDKDTVKYIDQLYNSSEKMFLKQHKDWYVNERFVRGDHWIIFNKTLNRIQTIPVTKGEVRRTINKVRAQLRSVKNFIKRHQPRWECHPDNSTDEAYENARKKNKIIQSIYRNRGIKRKLTDVIINSLKYSVGILEGGVFEKNGQTILDFWVDNTFDVVFDPYAATVQDCRYIFKTFVRPVEALYGNDNYKTDKNKGELADNKEAASEYKNILELEKYNKDNNKDTKDLETAIVKELWMKYEVDGKTKLRVITIAGNNILRVYEPEYRRYPFFVYTPESTPDAIYGEPWVKDLISPNKALDKTVSQVESYVQRMLAGKWLIKQGTEVSTITDNGAEKIFYKGNVPPTQQNLPALPSTPFNLMSDLERWIEELGGAREASLGRAPGSLQSGKAVEALQAADAATVAEPIENLELFLQEVGGFVLEVIADHTIASESIVEDGEEIKYIGSNLPEGAEVPKDTMKIGPENDVKVLIAPEVAYSDDAKKEWMMRLAEAGLVDEQTLLEQFQFTNVADIMERVEKHKKEEYQQDMVKQRESHRTDGNGPEDTADYADQENMQMASGQTVPPTPKALWTPEHTQLHMAFIQENRDAYEQNQAAFDEHIANEENYQ